MPSLHAFIMANLSVATLMLLRKKGALMVRISRLEVVYPIQGLQGRRIISSFSDPICRLLNPRGLKDQVIGCLKAGKDHQKQKALKPMERTVCTPGTSRKATSRSYHNDNSSSNCNISSNTSSRLTSNDSTQH